MFAAYLKYDPSVCETVGDSRGQVFRKLVQMGLDPSRFDIVEITKGGKK